MILSAVTYIKNILPQNESAGLPALIVLRLNQLFKPFSIDLVIGPIVFYLLQTVV